MLVFEKRMETNACVRKDRKVDQSTFTFRKSIIMGSVGKRSIMAALCMCFLPFTLNSLRHGDIKNVPPFGCVNRHGEIFFEPHRSVAVASYMDLFLVSLT